MHILIWSFPLLFVLHDIEEIIGLKGWINKNSAFLSERFSPVSRLFTDYSTTGMVIAAAEELVVCLIICSFAYFRGEYGLWLGCFIVYALHLLIHLFQCAAIRMYIPAAATSVLLLPLSVYIVFKCALLTKISALEIAVSTLWGTIIVGTNLVFAQRLIGITTRGIKKYAHIEPK